MRASSNSTIAAAERQLRPHRVERRAEVVQNVSDQFVQVHGDALATGKSGEDGTGFFKP